MADVKHIFFFFFNKHLKKRRIPKEMGKRKIDPTLILLTVIMVLFLIWLIRIWLVGE